MTDKELMGILRMSGEPAHLYAAQRISELRQALESIQEEVPGLRADHEAIRVEVQTLIKERNEAQAQLDRAVAVDRLTFLSLDLKPGDVVEISVNGLPVNAVPYPAQPNKMFVMERSVLSLLSRADYETLGHQNAKK